MRPPSVLWTGAIVAFFSAVQLVFALRPVERTHKWRQADTAAVSRNLAFESPNVLRPRIDMRGDLTGITGMEFPAYQAVVALAMRALETDADQVGKAVALIALLGAWWAIAAVLVRRFDLHPAAVHGALATSPLLFVYGSRFMPESFALLLGAVAVERFDAWWERRGFIRLLAAAVAIMLAALVRPYIAFMGLTMLVGAGILARKRDAAAGAVAALGVLALAPFAAWYFWWVPELVRTYGIRYFFMGSPVRDNVAAMGGSALWRLVLFVIAQELISWQMLPVAVLGALVFRRRVRGRSDAWIWWTIFAGVPALAVPGVVLLTGLHVSPHSYYLLALVPSVALVLASGFDDIRVRWPRTFPWIVGAAVAALPLTLVHAFRRDPAVDRYATIVPQVSAKVSPGDLVAVEGPDLDAWRLHPLRRKGWVEPRSRLEDAAYMADLGRRGCRWVVSEDGPGYRLDALDHWLARLGEPVAGASP